jgi:hypothetical protein
MKYLYALLFPLALVLAGCDMGMAHLTGRATEEWTHHYTLSSGGELRIANTNGKIDVEAADGPDVEVRAEKIARAATDTGAQELLPRIRIKEEVSPERVFIKTEGISGLMIGAGFEVRYHVRAPKSVFVNVTNTNGQIALNGLGGKVHARTTNGAVVAKAITGGVEASTTNGMVNIDVAAVGQDRISARTTNGGVSISLPESAKADLSASWTNGGINVSPDLKVDVSERSRRRFEGRMNGGGTPIELQTTNGGIRVRTRNTQAEEPDATEPTLHELHPSGPKAPKAERERGQSH